MSFKLGFILFALISISAATSIHSLTREKIDRFLLNKRIVGGNTAAPGQFPYQASLRFFGLFHFCGGSIISNRWILSAAHCTDGLLEEYLYIALGAHHIYDVDHMYPVNRVVNHPEYDLSYYYIYNDISLIETVDTIEFSTTIQPISIGTGEHVGAGIWATSSGWGDTQYGGPPPEYLQYLQMVTLTVEDCRARHTNELAPWITEDTICAYSNEKGRGNCHGDSGGPLVNNGTVIGVVSFGEACAFGRPDGFTRVSLYVPWILDVTEGL